MKFVSAACLLGLATQVSTTPIFDGNKHLSFKNLDGVTSDSLQNVHIDYVNEYFDGELHMVYADCNLIAVHQAHSVVGRTLVKSHAKPKRFVWIVPESAISGGCLHAFSGSELLGRSNSITIGAPLKKRQVIADVADPSGPWFDGVAYMKSKNNSASFVASAKDQKIAILGGGMAGLLTSLLLQSVGVEDWHIMESSQRVGGRIRTKYLNGTSYNDYQYQEMGPMRFPVSVKYAPTNETLAIKDHEMVFQLAEVLNIMNGNNSDLAVNFIPWIQSSPNVPVSSNRYRMPNGRIPNRAQLTAAARRNATFAAQTSSNATEAAHASEAVEEFLNLKIEKMRLLASNVFEAHKQAIDDGIFNWSEANYLKYALGVSANVTDFVAGAGGSALWDDLYDDVYFAATTWKTIDKGLEALPRAFLPHVANKTTFGRYVSGLSYKPETDKVTVSWREEGNKFALETNSSDFDYVVNAVPFSKVRLWRLPAYSSLLSRAITTMNYAQSCKISLHYKTRFWEHLSPPIIGGCGSTDIPGVGSVCYPAYKINSTGPGVILGSYISGNLARSVAALSTEDHVALIQRAMIEVHGEIAAEQWTGNFDRQCWEVDEHQAGAWADPLVGQQDLYIPAYFQTEFKTVFVGEHTSYTHAWIFSALESAVRGTAQLLLDMGLVDEAKTITNAWMGRWLDV